jgi:hypothetical protein
MLCNGKPWMRLPQIYRARSIEYGAGMLDDFKHPDNVYTAALSSHNAENDPVLQANARMAECVAALYYDLDPFTVLNWSRKPDGGADFTYCGLRPDVKNTAMEKRACIWPLHKNHLLADKQFDILILVKHCEDRTTFEMTGWCTKREFIMKRLTAGPGHYLTTGTWFVHQNTLHDMEELPRLLKQLKRAG